MTSGDERVMVSERLLACDTLVRELHVLDVGEVSESELTSHMSHAQANAEWCTSAWRDQADGEHEQLLATHRGRQLRFQALLLELALSDRFDGQAGYCDILDETFALLFTGLADLESALQVDAIEAQIRARMIELRDLDVEAIDVLVVHRAENCP